MENKRLGIISGLSAYLLWGMLGVFWELLSGVPAMDTLAYRIVWSLVTISVVLTFQKSWKEVWHVIIELIQNHKMGLIILSAFLISINWFLYIDMVTHKQATEASLSYYDNATNECSCRSYFLT